MEPAAAIAEAATGAAPGVVARFRAKVLLTPGCHWWLGAVADDGYGRFQAGTGFGAPIVRAHRFAYRLDVGPIPAGAVVMHDCDETICVRPDHLIAGTQGENLAMAARRDRVSSRWRWGGADRRRAAGRARAIRACLLAHGYDPERLAQVLAAGDPRADQLMLQLD